MKISKKQPTTGVFIALFELCVVTWCDKFKHYTGVNMYDTVNDVYVDDEEMFDLCGETVTQRLESFARADSVVYIVLEE